MGRKFRALGLALVLGAVYGLPHRRAHADSTGGIPPGGAPPETSGGCAGDAAPPPKQKEPATSNTATPTNPTDSSTTAKPPARPSSPTFGDGRCGTTSTPPCGNPEAPQHGVP
jgi:hypothetical protein